MGEAINIVNLELSMHTAAFTPIHKFIYQLIPYLEQRKQVCDKYINWNNKTEDDARNLIECKNHIDNNIKQILGIE